MLTLECNLFALERELMSEIEIPISFGKDAIIYLPAQYSHRGSYHWPPQLVIGMADIINPSALLQGSDRFVLKLPFSVGRAQLSFNELEHYNVVRRIYKETHITDLVKSVYVSENSLETGVQMDGQNLTLTANQKDWVGDITKDGQPFDSYRISLEPRWNDLSCEQVCLGGKEFQFSLSGVRGTSDNRLSNVQSIQKVFPSKRECEQFHSDFIRSYYNIQPEDEASMITLTRKLDTIHTAAENNSSIVLEAYQEVLSANILGHEFFGTSISFPLRLIDNSHL